MKNVTCNLINGKFCLFTQQNFISPRLVVWVLLCNLDNLASRYKDHECTVKVILLCRINFTVNSECSTLCINFCSALLSVNNKKPVLQSINMTVLLEYFVLCKGVCLMKVLYITYISFVWISVTAITIINTTIINIVWLLWLNTL